jgi:hypothetical protein
MKRKDFLTRMRNRRRGDQLELREPERRRAIDWRTLRVELPPDGGPEGSQEIALGQLTLLSTGVRLQPNQPCWVRGYRKWTDDDGLGRAEFQYRPVEGDSNPPPGATAVAAEEVWQP